MVLEIDQVCMHLFSLTGDVIWTEMYNIVVIKMFLSSSESGYLFLEFAYVYKAAVALMGISINYSLL